MQEQRSSDIREFSGALRDRPYLLEEYLAFLLRNVTPMRVEKHLAAPGLRIQTQVRFAGGFGLIHTSATGGMTYRYARRALEIARGGHDRFHVCMQIRGKVRISQFDRSRDLEPGSYVLVSESDPVVTESVGGESDDVDFLMPQAFVDQRLTAARRLCVRPQGESKSFQDLVLGTMRSFGQNAWGLTTGEFLSSARLVGELVLLALGGLANSSADEGCVRAANLSRAKQIIRKRLAEPDLTLADVAREAGISLRYLHKLFRAEGLTMYEFLKSERLRKARQLLEVPPLRRVSITDVFLECGFSDKSYFSRAFKQEFGIRPSEVISSRTR